MKTLNIIELQSVSAGEIIPGDPSAVLQCLNAKLMVAVGREAAGFDVTVGASALAKHCPSDFGDFDTARNYVLTGGIPMPS